MKQVHPSILLILATILWGGNFVIGKAVANSLSPFTLAFLRWCIAILFFFPIIWKPFKRDIPLFIKHWKIILLLAFTGVAAFNTLVYIGVHDTTSINASLMNMVTPIFIYILSYILLKEKIHKMQAIGTVLSFVGVLCIISNGSLKQLFHLHFNRGDLIVVVAVILWSIYSLFVKKYSNTLPGKTTFMASMLVGTMMLLPFFLYEITTSDTVISWNRLNVFAIFYTGIFASIIAFLSWNSGVVKYGANRCGIYLNFIPVFASIFAVIFLDEQLQMSQVIGGLCVVCGVYITNLNYSMKQKKVFN